MTFNPNYQSEYWEREDLKFRRTSEHPVVRTYVYTKIREIHKHIAIHPEMTLLDVGCGNGFFTTQFSRLCHTTGIDLSKRMIGLNPHDAVYIMDARQIQYPDNSFDIVFCHSLLHHVIERSQVIQEMKRVSKKYIILLEPNRNNPLMCLFALMVKEEKGAIDFSLKYMKNLTETYGLRTLAAFSQGCIVPNKFPKILLPLIKPFDIRNPLGFTNFIICEK